MQTGFLIFALLALSVRLSLSEEPGSQRRLVFARDPTIWIGNLDGTKMRKLVRGADPCISPDGAKVAFTMSPAGGQELLRYIAVVEVSTGATKVFKETPSNNCFGPVWSPDGSQILFEIFVENHWRLGLVDPDGSGFRFFKTPVRDQGWFSLAWAPDSKSIFCQDLENLCRFDVNGELLASWEISKIIPKGDMDRTRLILRFRQSHPISSWNLPNELEKQDRSSEYPPDRLAVRMPRRAGLAS
jgi:WD40-like Beta Propeller Repeat